MPNNFLKSLLLLLAVILFHIAPASAAERGILVREAGLYIAPDNTSQKLAQVSRGREVVVLQRSRNWLNVLASVSPERDVTGWLLEKGVVLPSTPNGDRIIFGEAVDSEAEGAKRQGRRGAAQDAMNLYGRMAEYYPASPLAPEALYREADIRWQIEKDQVMSRPSAKDPDPNMRVGMDEERIKKVMKKYPGTKWADLAAFDLIDNKLCGEWQGLAKCPEKEAEIYEHYAADHPKSPKAAEALYEAAWRYAALIEIYKTREEPARIGAAKAHGIALAQRVATEFPQTDWAPRAMRLNYLLEQNIPTYGNVIE